MRRKRVTGQQRVHIPRVNQLGKRGARIVVECDGRSEHPYDLSMRPVVPQHVVQIVVIAGKRRLARAVLAEREHVALGRFLRKPVRMYVDTLACILRPTADDRIALLEMPELDDRDAILLVHRHAVHAAFGGQQPTPADLEIFRKDAHRVIPLRRNKIGRTRSKPRFRRAIERFCGKIGRPIRAKLQCHRRTSTALNFNLIIPRRAQARQYAIR